MTGVAIVIPWIKTWYAPLLFRPQLFLRGVRLLFGDHAMFFRRADFLTVGGCDPSTSAVPDRLFEISVF